jgi:hypothetical protein
MVANGAGPDRTSWIGRASTPASRDTEPTFYSASEVGPPRRRRSGITTFLVIVGLSAVFCVGAAFAALTWSGALKGDSAMGSAPPGLNTAVRDGKLEFVVTSVSCGHKSLGRDPIVRKPEGQYCIVALTVTNIGTEAVPFADTFQKAIGPGGEEYGTDTTAGIFANEGGRTIWNVIDPGNKVTGKIVFDIPKDAKIAKLVLHDTPFSGGVTVVL